jgi:hypothetical protein
MRGRSVLHPSPMRTIHRRHTSDRAHTLRKKRGRQCPIQVEGTLRGRMIRKSLDVRNWAAEGIARFVSVEEALDKWIADAQGRKVKERSIDKMQQIKKSLLGHSSVKVTEKHYAPWVRARQQKLEEAAMKA